MARVNLRDLYPHYTGDKYIEIPDDVLHEIENCEREEENYRRSLRRKGILFALSSASTNEIDNMVLLKHLTLHEIYERKQTAMLLHTAITKLPDKQAKRIYAHFFLGMNKAEIAKAEGVTYQIVARTIAEGLSRLKKYLVSKI